MVRQLSAALISCRKFHRPTIPETLAERMWVWVGVFFLVQPFVFNNNNFFFGFPLAVHRVAGASPIDSCTQIDIERLQSIAWPTHQQPTMDSRSMFRFHVDGFGLVIFSIAGNSIALVERSVSRFVRERECVKPFLLLSKRIFFSLLGFWSRDGQAAII